MNSEELELSLRTEFESYLKSVLAEIRQEAAEFQSKIETDFDNHKARFDESFKAYVARFDSEHAFDDAFRGSVSEHLRLARDEGAKITANAMAEAEKLDQPVAAQEAKYDGIRDAVNDISSKDSQSAILKSLVHHTAEFAPRGAFFIIKNGHFAGWKVFGSDNESAESAVREIHFSTSADSILGAAIASLSTVDASAGEHSENSIFLEPLQLGQPGRMFAIPLVARGRGVAVLYVDHGTDGANINREALETLVRVAALTVELLASTQTAKAENRTVGAADFEDAQHEGEGPFSAPEGRYEDTVREVPAAVETDSASGFAFTDSISPEAGYPSDVEPIHSYESPTSVDSAFDGNSIARHVPETVPEFVTESPFEAHVPHETEPVEQFVEEFTEPVPAASEMVFESGGSIESAAFETSPFENAAEEYQPSAPVTNSGFGQVVQPVIEATVSAVPQARLSDRPVDLPIEVPDEERRIHNDARRFARLLVSEIKLYNEKKVIEGREAQDLYDRLREAIDRSREMYDKRVQPPVAAKFDYFHYEIVNSLADGDAARLGSSYPGSRV
ncbi:MAG: hypothetical protein ABIO36_08415 [Pyrinomonadaceae bacterium]